MIDFIPGLLTGATLVAAAWLIREVVPMFRRGERAAEPVTVEQRARWGGAV